MKFLQTLAIISTVASMSLSSSIAFENKLVGYWPFDEVSGNNTAGLKVSLIGFGKALEFDGKNDHKIRLNINLAFR